MSKSNGQLKGFNSLTQISKPTIKLSSIHDTLLEGSVSIAEALETLGLRPASSNTVISEQASSSPYSLPLDRRDDWRCGETISLDDSDDEEPTAAFTKPSPGTDSANEMNIPQQETIISPLSQQWDVAPRGVRPSTYESPSTVSPDEGFIPPVGSGCGHCLRNGFSASCRLSERDRRLFEERYREFSEDRTDQWPKWSKRAQWSGMMPTCQRCRMGHHRCNFPEIPKSIVWDKKGRR